MADAKKKKSYNDHVLVPKHEKLSDKQKQQLLEEYNCTAEQLPRIKMSDAAIRDISAKAGDIIKVSRDNKTEGTSVFYRVVINE